MILVKIFLTILLVCVLTIITQIGGIIFLISILTFGPIEKRVTLWWRRGIIKSFSFCVVYLVFVFVIIPPTAYLFGRVPLPVFETRHLKPANILTCILNRNYVRPELRDVVYEVAEELNREFPAAKVNYLDANFPFIDEFPLFPHRSHDDGKKLDLSFQYNDTATGVISNGVPSLIGYGICEEPRDSERDMPAYCEKKGYYQYNFLRRSVPQGPKDKFAFDDLRTKELVDLFASHKEIGRIFIEPHLKDRLELTTTKIRFHGCQAVRHDDHLHVQLK